MAEKRQAQPDDERTPEQWAQFRQAEAKNQEELTRQTDKQNLKKAVTLTVNPSKHGSTSTNVGESNG